MQIYIQVHKVLTPTLLLLLLTFVLLLITDYQILVNKVLAACISSAVDSLCLNSERETGSYVCMHACERLEIAISARP